MSITRALLRHYLCIFHSKIPHKTKILELRYVAYLTLSGKQSRLLFEEACVRFFNHIATRAKSKKISRRWVNEWYKIMNNDIDEAHRIFDSIDLVTPFGS